jgi:hypothetical protein
VLLPAFYKKQLFTKTIVQENKPLNNIRWHGTLWFFSSESCIDSVTASFRAWQGGGLWWFEQGNVTLLIPENLKVWFWLDGWIGEFIHT